MGMCQGQNDMGSEGDRRSSLLTWTRAPWFWGASSSAQRLGHDTRHTAGLCSWPPCSRRPQWRAMLAPGPFPPKFSLWSSFSHLQNQAAPRPWPCTAPGSGPGGARTECPRSLLHRAFSYPTGQPGAGAAPGEQSSRDPCRAGQRAQRWPKASGKVAGTIADLWVGPGPLPVAASRTGLPIRL